MFTQDLRGRHGKHVNSASTHRVCVHVLSDSEQSKIRLVQDSESRQRSKQLEYDFNVVSVNGQIFGVQNPDVIAFASNVLISYSSRSRSAQSNNG